MKSLYPPRNWQRSEELVKSIDIDDIDFVALTLYLRGSLWTGDKVLYNGLKKKGFNKVFTTNELLLKRNK
jgi:predicted nucleic acid-binding protein